MLITLFFYLKSHFTYSAIDTVVTIDKCTINFLAHENFQSYNRPSLSPHRNAEALEIISNNNINCKEYNEVYIYKLKLKNQQWMYLGHCKNGAECSSSYIRE